MWETRAYGRDLRPRSMTRDGKFENITQAWLGITANMGQHPIPETPPNCRRSSVSSYGRHPQDYEPPITIERDITPGDTARTSTRVFAGSRSCLHRRLRMRLNIITLI